MENLSNNDLVVFGVFMGSALGVIVGAGIVTLYFFKKKKINFLEGFWVGMFVAGLIIMIYLGLVAP